MLTHEDDYRIMTDEDMAMAKKLSRLTNEHGSTPHEARLMACIRLLLAHIEGITDGAIAAVDGLSTKRDPPRNDMTDVYDEGYDACREDTTRVVREAIRGKDEGVDYIERIEDGNRQR